MAAGGSDRMKNRLCLKGSHGECPGRGIDSQGRSFVCFCGCHWHSDRARLSSPPTSPSVDAELVATG